MDQQYQQYNRCHSAHDTHTYPNVEQQAMGCNYGLYPAPPTHQEWFHLMLLPGSLASMYRPLPYLENASDSTPQYWPGLPIEASSRPQTLAPPQGVPAVPTVPTVASAASVTSAPVHTTTTTTTTPSCWDAWNCSREGSRSPAEDRGGGGGGGSSSSSSGSGGGGEEEVWEPEDLRRMGYLDAGGNWRCRYEGCRSTRVFVRACDLRKHFRGHDKYFFCAERPCAEAGVGFSTKKDYQRHMGSHQPAIRCPHPDCGRIFSRKDNMREHFRKIHMRLRNNLFPRPCRRSRRASEDARSPPAPSAKRVKGSTWEAATTTTTQGAGLRQRVGVIRQT
ncbi:hypothetical protein LX36DRAFT_708082 [Colletotrichum falcatum]|nr:hypothetical protein LX36DRAFT_708082 [Colletotrichum falcatum]